jgi:hypothetical protein
LMFVLVIVLVPKFGWLNRFASDARNPFLSGSIRFAWSLAHDRLEIWGLAK